MLSQGHGGPNPGGKITEGDETEILRTRAPEEMLDFLVWRVGAGREGAKDILNGIPG
jgi:hypothetical protein